MKKYVLIIVTCLLWAGANAQEQIIADANASARTLQGSFDKIRISDAIKVIITQSDTESLAVSAAEEKYKENLKTDIVEGTLRIYLKSNINSWARDMRLKVYVSFKKLTSLDISGASDVAIVGQITPPELVVEISGASTLKGEIVADRMEVKMSGASKAVLSGKAARLSVECHGATDLKAFQLVSQVCNAKVSGASDIEVNIENELNATASGASRMHYKGNPAVANIKSSGSSSIASRD